MKTLIIIIGLVCVAVECFVGPGCGTLMRHGKGEPPGVYRGVKADAEAIKEEAKYAWVIIPFTCIDLAICCVTDTLVLPLDLTGEKPPAKTEPKPK